MHILFVAKHYFGNPDFVRLSTELARKKHRISVATCFRAVDRPVKKDDVNIFEIKPLIGIHGLVRARSYPLSFSLSKMYRIVLKEGINIIHALDDYSINTVTAALVSRATKVPFVCTIQGMGAKTGHPFVDAIIELYDRTIERVITRGSSKVILLSKHLFPRAAKLGVDKSKVDVIPAGVDYDFFDPERPEVKNRANLLRKELNIGDDIVIGYVGRLIPTKGVAHLILAVKQIQRENPNIVLLIVGDGPQREDLRIMSKDLRIRAKFTGWQDETAPYYALMNVFALPSFSEGLPNVVLEAMAMEKPIVATNIGGIPDLVKNGENGYLVPVRDHQQMALALRKLILDSDLRTSMGSLSRQKIERFFAWDAIVQKVEKIYDEIA